MSGKHCRLRSDAVLFTWSDPEVIKLFSCSTQLSMKFILLINLKILTIFFKLLSCSTQLSMLSWVEHEKSLNCWYFYFYDQVKFHAQLSWAWKKFYNLGAWVLCLIRSICQNIYGKYGEFKSSPVGRGDLKEILQFLSKNMKNVIS